MGKRSNLQLVLEDVLGSNAVYFQPPPNLQMAYPCIVYKRDTADTRFAGNAPYRYTQRYMVTLISQDPDIEVFGKVAALPMCIFNRSFVANNLNHNVFNLYF